MTLKLMNDFSFDGYRGLLQYFQATHEYITFREYENNLHKEKIIILRHDIDCSLKQALRMATIEAEYGIRSTYFVLFSSPYYNIFDEENIDIPRKIKEMGHEIGLHYDVNVIMKGKTNSTSELLDSQIHLLADISDSPVSSIAMHNPSTSGVDIFRETKYINVYHDKFTKDMGYFSDSCMAWRNSVIENFEAGTFPSKIQLLIHPILWSEEVLTRWVKFDRFIIDVEKEIGRNADMVRNIWKNHSGVIEHDLRESKLQTRKN